MKTFKPQISETNQKVDSIPVLHIPLISEQNLQYYISFADFYSTFPYEAKCLFKYIAKVGNYEGGITDLCRKSNYKSVYTIRKTGNVVFNIPQFKRLGIKRLQDNGVISVSRNGTDYIIKLNKLYFGE